MIWASSATWVLKKILVFFRRPTYNFPFSQMRVSESRANSFAMPSGSILDKIYFVNFPFSILFVSLSVFVRVYVCVCVDPTDGLKDK